MTDHEGNRKISRGQQEIDLAQGVQEDLETADFSQGEGRVIINYIQALLNTQSKIHSSGCLREFPLFVLLYHYFHYGT